jgi:hypothetical protein
MNQFHFVEKKVDDADVAEYDHLEDAHMKMHEKLSWARKLEKLEEEKN